MRANLVIKRGLYYVVITYKDENDITKKKWFGTGLSEIGNKRKAEEMKAKFLLDFERSLNKKKSPAITSKTLFADYIEDWLERTKLNLQVSTYSSYKQQVQKIANYFREKNILLIKLQPMDISNYYKYLQDNGKSIQLCEHYHVNIRKSLQSALKAGLIDYNPADRIDRPKSPKTVAKYYDVEQLETLFKCLEGDRLAYIYEITAYYGLRRSEMVGLKWENVDFKNNIINLKHSVVQTRLNGKSIIVKKDRMKNQSSLRSLPLLPVVKEILLEQKKIQEDGIYWGVKNSYRNYDGNGDDASDTLTTKILMGTFGCIPAFDRYLKDGISIYIKNNNNIETNDYKLGKKIEDKKSNTFLALSYLAINKKSELKLSNYPPMKCLDIYFWQIGYELDIAASLVNGKNKPNKKKKLLEKAKELRICNIANNKTDEETFKQASEQIINLNK